jgi:hypothetical protein
MQKALDKNDHDAALTSRINHSTKPSSIQELPVNTGVLYVFSPQLKGQVDNGQ